MRFLSDRSNYLSIILAGGQSKRMGRDKAFLPFKGKTFLRYVLETAQSLSEKIILVVNKDFSLYETEIKDINSEIIFVKDRNPFDGPLNGIYSSLEKVDKEFVYLFTCDTPIISLPLMKYYQQIINDYEAVIPVIEDKIQPLNTLYRKTAIEKTSIYERGNKSLISWLKNIKYKPVSKEEIISFDKNLLTYKSINTPEDYQNLLKYF